MKGVLPGLVRWARRIGTRDFCSVLGALVDLVQENFPHQIIFHLICPHHLASWAGSCAESPVS